MDHKTYAEEYTSLEEMLKEIFKEEKSQSFYDAWADTFRIEKVEKNRVVIAYFGEPSLRTFKKECGDILSFNLCLEFGHRKKIKFVSQKRPKELAEKEDSSPDLLPKELSQNPRVKRNLKAAKFFIIGLIFACFAASFAVLLCVNEL